MEPVTQLLSELVAIPSMNPMVRLRDGAEYSERNLAEYVAALLKKHSIDVTLQEVSANRPNVVGYIDAKARETVLLEAHLDTVHADHMTIEPFTPVVREGKLYGRGSCDTKGSMAAFLQAVINTLKKPKQLRYNIVLLFVADEEYRFTGADFAARHGLKANFGIAGEPTQLRIVRAHKGVTRWKIQTRGVAAHSAYPERGRNAIYSMSKIIQILELYAARLRYAKSHPLLGTPTMSIGVIEGGQAVNVVPDRCWIEVDRRSLPGETAESVIQPVRELLKDFSDSEIGAPYLSVAGMEVDEHAPIVKHISRSVQHVMRNVSIEAAHYATDAGVYNSIGIPTIVFGPGDIAQAHTDAEYIELNQLHHAVAIIEDFLTT
ncbi:MAG: M20 family metallopeptidase [Ignavibacteriales bacterium]|nr:M20 family metallopeptidase [Ignavibacteriales bacterium]